MRMGRNEKMSEARENYLKLLKRVKEMYGDHNQIYESDGELFIAAGDRYGGKTYITLTEEQVVNLAREAYVRFIEGCRSIEGYLEDYDYFKKKGESVSKEAPETT